jgi:hypothetical protein
MLTPDAKYKLCINPTEDNLKINMPINAYLNTMTPTGKATDFLYKIPLASTVLEATNNAANSCPILKFINRRLSVDAKKISSEMGAATAK